MEGVIGAPCSVRTIVKRRKGISQHATWYVSHIHVIYITCPSMREPEKTFGRGRLGKKQDNCMW